MKTMKFLIAILIALPSAMALAQSVGKRPVRIIVPYSAGGPSDVVTRVVARQMSVTMGRPFIIENKPGASGRIGMEAASRSAADGNTLVMFSLGGSVLNVVLREDKLPYNLLKDFTPVGNMVDMAQLLAVNTGLPVHSLAELVEYAKQHPGKLSYGSSGIGSSSHLTGELFQLVTGTKMLHVPYQGTGPASADVATGQIQLVFTEIPVLLPQIEGGKLRAIALGKGPRSPLIPDVPIMSEDGVDLEAYNWFGLQAPAGTPAPAISELNAHLVRALRDPATQATLRAMGAEPAPDTPAEFGKLVESELAKWRKVAQEAKLTVEH